MNIAQHLDATARHAPARPAILFEGATLAYGELAAAVDRAAHGLAALGVAAGDRVALLLPNIPAFPVAYLATQKVGAIAVSINAMLTTEEIDYVLDDSGAAAAFTTAELLPRLAPLLGLHLPRERVVICEGEADGHPSLAGLGAGAAGDFPARDLPPEAPAAILYTSGTTGKQKGAVLSHGNVVSNMLATARTIGVAPSDRLILFLPLFHCFGQNFIMNTALAAGATIVLHRRFDPAACLDSIERDGVTMFFAVPTIYIGLLNAGVAPGRLASIRYYFSAAATMPVEVAARWQAAYGRAIHEGYGLTETSPFACYNHRRAYRPGSVGAPIEGVEMRVVDLQDREVPVGEWGEILIKGPNVMLGYWNRPAETAAALRGGWFHSGDLGYVDADGYFFLVDRVKDMINTAGFKIWPREVEEVLYRHPAVKECAVVGQPDPLKGELAKAYIVRRAGATVSEAEIEAFCREHLAAYKAPRAVEFIDALPKSATGKVLKRILREQAAREEVRA
jgi:long-chain acyl-CoA synthetase